jgi:hypothetical protein
VSNIDFSLFGSISIIACSLSALCNKSCAEFPAPSSSRIDVPSVASSDLTSFLFFDLNIFLDFPLDLSS